MSLIQIKNLTKDYGDKRGIFDINLSIEKGEIFGFVGTNGSGKTTTIRHLMGFLKPQKGSATIDGLDCWENSAEIKKYIGYLPGEINFPDAHTGMDFLKNQAELLGVKDMSYAENLIKRLQLDPSANLKKNVKGNETKTAIVAAFMANPEILILDEPTTGLDPLMRAEFIDIINEEKEKGKTIFMSSHMFDEVEKTCDKVALIKNGRIIDIKSTKEIKHNEDKVYKIEFKNKEDYQKFISDKFELIKNDKNQNQVTISINDKDINKLTKVLKQYDIKFINEIKFTLEKYFEKFY